MSLVETSAEAILSKAASLDGLTDGVEAGVADRARHAAVSFCRWVAASIITKFEATYEMPESVEEQKDMITAEYITTFMRMNYLPVLQDVATDVRGSIRGAVHQILEISGDGNCQFTALRTGQLVTEAFALAREQLRSHERLKEVPEGLRKLDGHDEDVVMGGLDLRTQTVEWLSDFDAIAPNGLPRGVTIDLMNAQTGAVDEGMNPEAAERALLSGCSDPIQTKRRLEYLLKMSRSSVWGDDVTIIGASACMDSCVAVYQQQRELHDPNPVGLSAEAERLPQQPKVRAVSVYHDAKRRPDSTIRCIWQGRIVGGTELAHYESIVPSYIFWLISSVLGPEAIQSARPLL